MKLSRIFTAVSFIFIAFSCSVVNDEGSKMEESSELSTANQIRVRILASVDEDNAQLFSYVDVPGTNIVNIKILIDDELYDEVIDTLIYDVGSGDDGIYYITSLNYASPEMDLYVGQEISIKVNANTFGKVHTNLQAYDRYCCYVNYLQCPSSSQSSINDVSFDKSTNCSVIVNKE